MIGGYDATFSGLEGQREIGSENKAPFNSLVGGR